MRRSAKIALVVAAAGTAAVGQAAYTAGITGISASKVIGFQSTTITGATATSVAYTYSTDNSTITTIDVTLTGDTTGSHLYVGYNALAPTDCGVGTYDGTTSTTISCTSLGWTVNGITQINFILH